MRYLIAIAAALLVFGAIQPELAQALRGFVAAGAALR